MGKLSAYTDAILFFIESNLNLNIEIIINHGLGAKGDSNIFAAKSHNPQYILDIFGSFPSKKKLLQLAQKKFCKFKKRNMAYL